jgi:hypothetical protein
MKMPRLRSEERRRSAERWNTIMRSMSYVLGFLSGAACLLAGAILATAAGF